MARKPARSAGSSDRPPARSPLEPYREKRSPEKTPEPFGPEGRLPAGRLFVIQKHSARRLHYDLRLEWNGTLHSWAVPQGLPIRPDEKRLAVEVEDHPIEYADFEGIIPKGNYGAGPVIVWDRGRWSPREGPGEGIEAGKLHFRLDGYKLHGTWILVRTKDDPRSWILFRKLEPGEPPDGGAPPPEASILSGLTVEELREGRDRAAELRADLERTGAKRGVIEPARVELMLAQAAEKPFSAPGWVYEIKYDGYRALGSREGGPHLRSRGGEDLTLVFPEIARALAALPFPSLVLDGELVILDDAGRPDFAALHERAAQRNRIDTERAARESPATWFVFDLLAAEGYDLRDRPLLERKALLRKILPPSGPIRACDHIEEKGAEMYAAVREMGLEGVIAKKADSPYESRRSRSWLKFVVDRTGDFLIVGYTVDRQGGARPGTGAVSSAEGLSALHLAAADGSGGWAYAGRVGSGFTDRGRAELLRILQRHARKDPVCAVAIREATPAGKRSLWCEAIHVVTVKYRAFTPDGMLRAPVFVRLREDKRPEDCDPAPIRKNRGGSGSEPARSPDRGPGVATGEPAGPALGKPAEATGEGRATNGGITAPSGAMGPKQRGAPVFRHLDKVFWPEDGLTKGDLIDYYRTVSEWMLPYLKDRPVVLTRYPDGIGGKSFYQKDAPAHAAGLIRTARISSRHARRDIAYFVCDEPESLLHLANLGSIPIHVWPSRVSSIESPDWCIVDLDPKEAPFEHVVRLAVGLRELCEEIGLPSWPKTSGSTGLHILLPLPPESSFEQSRLLAQLLTGILEARYPDISTTERIIPARRGRVYLDALQNRRGQLLVAPYSVRPLPGAPVSAPLEWREVNERLTPRAFNIRNLRERLLKQREDPMRELLETRIELGGVLRRLERVVPPRSR